jgi:hypothetical protein
MNKHRHNRKLLSRMGLGLITAVLTGTILLILAVSGTAGSSGSYDQSPSHQYGPPPE